MKRSLPPMAVLVTVLMGVTACSGSSSANPQGAASGSNLASASGTAGPASDTDCSKVVKGGSFKVGVNQDAISFDTSQTQDNGSLWADMNIYDQLIEFNTEGTKEVPGLASSWDVKDGGKQIVFHLRTDAKFYDGTPVTADDVKFSLDRINSPKAVTNWTLDGLDSVKIVDDHTVEVTLKSPSPSFLSNLTLWGASIVSKKASEQPGADFKSKPVGSGPFYVGDWKPGQGVELKRNPYYWGKDTCGNQYPYADSINLQYVPDDNTRMTELQGGTIDATTMVPYNRVQSLNGVSGVVAAATPQLGVVSVSLNQRSVPAFKDSRVIQAMQYAIDRAAIVKTVFFGNATPAEGPIDPGVLYASTDFAYKFDLDKAKGLMKDSGFPSGFETSLSYPAGDSTAAATAAILQDELGKIGIKVSPAATDSTSLSAQEIAGKFDMRYGYGTSDVLDPAQNMVFCCVSTGPAQSGYTGWVNSEADALFAKSQTEMDPKAREQQYKQWQKIIMEQAPILWLANPANTFGYRDNVHGFGLQTTGHYILETVWKSS